MKINSIEIDTDVGRRVIQVSPPLEIDPAGEMPAPFRSLTELLWHIVCSIANNEIVVQAPKVEA